jgi:phosphatidylserine/phosphatidylglycerophosphate/cardiolipin synthase-like enzyme
MTKKSSSRPQPIWQTILIVIVFLLIAWVFRTFLGIDILGGVGGVTETISGEYITILFTDPQYPDEPATRPAGIDERLVDLIDGAQERVDLAAYELDLESVTDALLGAHASGVEVRVVTDGTYADEASIARLREAGVPVVARPDTGGGIMHNKFVVVDGTWVWTGSWNMTENGTFRNNNNAVLIASRALAENYSDEFAELFAGQFGGSSPEGVVNPVVNIQEQGEVVAQIETYFAPEDEAAQYILETLAEADSEVHFMAFVFTSDPLGDALIELEERGVEVYGVIDERSIGSQYSEFERLQDAGVEVLADGNPYVMHHKVIVVDGETVIFGSYNFSASAEERNDENVLIVHDPTVAAAFLAEFDRVYQDALANSP